MSKAQETGPRSFAVHPAMFGKSHSPLEMKPVKDGEAHLVQAAQLQHRVMYAFGEGRRGRPLKLWLNDQPIAVAGTSYSRLIRMSRGDTQMEVADAFLLAGLFDQVRRVLQNTPFVERTSTDLTRRPV